MKVPGLGSALLLLSCWAGSTAADVCSSNNGTLLYCPKLEYCCGRDKCCSNSLSVHQVALVVVATLLILAKILLCYYRGCKPVVRRRPTRQTPISVTVVPPSGQSLDPAPSYEPPPPYSTVVSMSPSNIPVPNKKIPYCTLQEDD